jgi:hypothetical protein
MLFRKERWLEKVSERLQCAQSNIRGFYIGILREPVCISSSNDYTGWSQFVLFAKKIISDVELSGEAGQMQIKHKTQKQKKIGSLKWNVQQVIY